MRGLLDSAIIRFNHEEIRPYFIIAFFSPFNELIVFA